MGGHCHRLYKGSQLRDDVHQLRNADQARQTEHPATTDHLERPVMVAQEYHRHPRVDTSKQHKDEIEKEPWISHGGEPRWLASEEPKQKLEDEEYAEHIVDDLEGSGAIA